MRRRTQGVRRRRGQGIARCPGQQGRARSAAAAADGPAAAEVAAGHRGRRGNRLRIRWHQGTSRTGAAAPCRMTGHRVRLPSRRWGGRGRDRAIQRWLSCRFGPCCPTAEATPAERRLPAPGAWSEHDTHPIRSERGCCIADDDLCDPVICRRPLDRRRSGVLGGFVAPAACVRGAPWLICRMHATPPLLHISLAEPRVAKVVGADAYPLFVLGCRLFVVFVHALV